VDTKRSPRCVTIPLLTERHPNCTQERKGWKEPRRKMEEGTEEAATKAREAPKKDALNPTKRITSAPIRTDVTPTPPPVALERPPPALSPAQIHKRQGPGKPDPDKTVIGNGYQADGENRDSTRTFLSPAVF